MLTEELLGSPGGLVGNRSCGVLQLSMQMSANIVGAFLEFLPPGSTILELGTGAGTKLLAAHYSVISVEHQPKYHTGHSELLTVPLATPKLPRLAQERLIQRFPDVTRWYDPVILEQALKGRTYDAILIDGPPGGATRAWMWVYYSRLFDTTVPVIVDDIHRRNEWKVARRIAQIKGQTEIIVRDADERKCFGVIK